MSCMDMTPSTIRWSPLIGLFLIDIFAAHGVIKKIPISLGFKFVLAAACARAIFADNSAGDSNFNILSLKFGKRTSIKREITGQAEEITGF